MESALRSSDISLTLSVGPGWHHEHLIRELAARGVALRIIYSWPIFSVYSVRQTHQIPHLLKQVRLYDGLVRVTWGMWRRIPHFRKFETPRTPIYSVYDFLASRYLGQASIFHGWSQISLHSLRKAKRRSIPTILDHPMLHVNAWLSLAREEYARSGTDTKGYYSLLPQALVRRMKLEYREADRILVPSSISEDTFLQNGIAAGKLVRIPYGVDTSAFCPGDIGRTDIFRVLYAGRLELLKGMRYLLDAWRMLDLHNAELWLVGRVMPEVEPFLKQGATRSIRIVGNVTREELAKYYQSADVFVLPSLCDGFGLVILEAMASGLPVIATVNTGGPDVVTDGKEGFVIPIRNSDALAERLHWFYSHRSQASEMGRRAREKVMSHFTWEHYGGRILEAYGVSYRASD